MKKKYVLSMLLTSIMSVYPFMNHGNSLNSNSIVHAQSGGWQKNNGTWYYYDASGAKQTGWLKEGNTWYYLKSNGAMATGWTKVNGTWYYLNSSGAMKTGWLKEGNTWYYLKPSGAMATGWAKDGNTYYYFEKSGAMKTGWLKEGNTWYYLKPSGAMATGWAKDGNTYYYFEKSGAMKTGWLKEGATWYYLKPSGAMATGWEKINNVWYYFYNSGTMATNITIDGWKIDSNGVATLESSSDSTQSFEEKMLNLGWSKGGDSNYSWNNGEDFVSLIIDNNVVHFSLQSTLIVFTLDDIPVIGDTIKLIYPNEAQVIIDTFDSVSVRDIVQESKINNYKITSSKGHRGGLYLSIESLNNSDFTPFEGWTRLPEDNYWYYYQNGVRQVGWITLGNQTYYLNYGTGVMKVGWHQIDDNWYYFYDSGAMAINTTIDGWKIDANGVATPESSSDSTNRVSIETLLSFLLSNGYKSTGVDGTYMYSDTTYGKMGIFSMDSTSFGFTLENNSSSFESVIKRAFNVILPTQGNRLFEIVSNPFDDQTLLMDGYRVEITQYSYGAVAVSFYY